MHNFCSRNQEIYKLPYISVTILFIALKIRIWHTQYKCTAIFQGIKKPNRNCSFKCWYRQLVWTLSTWPSLFREYRLRCSYKRVQKPCINWCYRSKNGFWTNLYQHLKLQFLLGFLIPSIYILLYISVTIVFIALKIRIWHIQYKCTDIFQGIKKPNRNCTDCP
jgi:hypothetical protein